MSTRSNEIGFQGKLADVLRSLNKIISFEYKDNLGEFNEGPLSSISGMAYQWSNEVPLREIIDWEKNPREKVASANIDFRLDRLNSVVAFRLPKLLKPVTVIQERGEGLLSYLEMGAHSPISRRLIELGIPRETALRIKLAVADDISLRRTAELQMELNDTALLGMVQAVQNRLNYWERLQIADIIKTSSLR